MTWLETARVDAPAAAQRTARPAGQAVLRPGAGNWPGRLLSPLAKRARAGHDRSARRVRPAMASPTEQAPACLADQFADGAA